MTLNVRVWARADWYWYLPAIGAEIAANVRGVDAARWFRVELRLVFLWLSVHIYGKEREEEESDQ